MKLIDLSVEFIKIDNHLKRNIDEFKKHVKSFENKNDKISYENNVLRRETLKSNRCEKWDVLINEVDSLNETFSKFTRGKYNHDTILSHQRLCIIKLY